MKWVGSELVYLYWRARITLVHWLGDEQCFTRNEDAMIAAAKRWGWYL